MDLAMIISFFDPRITYSTASQSYHNFIEKLLLSVCLRVGELDKT